MTANTTPVILIAGHWLGAWAWDEVLEHLNTRLASAIALTLPGLDSNDPDRASRTLDDQVAAIRDIIASHGDQPVVLVAHSGANGPASVVLDRYPELIARAVWVDSGPLSDGTAFAPDFPADAEELPLPPFDELGQQASLNGLSGDHLARFRARAVPQPASVIREKVTLSNDSRRLVPTTLICCSIPGEDLMKLAAAGDPMFAEVANLKHLNIVDLPTGHWPMWSCPRDLARAIEDAASHGDLSHAG